MPYPIASVRGTGRTQSVTSFLVTDIENCLLWLDGSDDTTKYIDAGSTLVSADGQAIYRIADKSGNNNHANQSTEANRPLHKVNIKNGLSIVRFDGSNDYMDGTTNITDTTITLFTVQTFDTASDYKGPILFGDTNSAGYHHASYGGKRTVLKHGKGFSEDDTITTTTWEIWASTQSGTTTKLYINGTEKTLTNSTTTPNAASRAYTIGDIQAHNKPFDGDIAEIILYDSALSDADRQRVEGYLSVKYGISI